jgi:hypothetical protein
VITRVDIEIAYEALPDNWKEVLQLPDRDRDVIIISHIVRLYHLARMNENLAITAFNS